MFWFGLAPGLHQRPGVATGQLDSTGQDWGGEGGRLERGKDTDPSVFLALTDSGRGYCRKREVEGGEEVG